MNNISQLQLLEQMQKIVQESRQSSHSVKESSTKDFGQFLSNQIDKVNQAQQVADDLTTKFSLGDPKVTLPQAMMATQKASIYSHFLTETRNKIINAYNEIMNMSV